MSARKKTPDLMSELLTGKPEGQKDSTPAHHKASIPVRHNTSIMVKATYYLPAEIVNGLEAFWLRERQEGRKTSKSAIVGEALKKYIR